VRLGRARTARRPSRSRGDALRDDVEGEVEVGGHEMQRALSEGQVFAEDASPSPGWLGTSTIVPTP
jgi:hypothetical protein